MPDSAKKAVFLSYASQDAEAARRIVAALHATGVEVWFDQSDLVGGDAWDAKIRRQIRECALFVPVISAATQARREGYFRLEWKLGAQRTHMMADGTPFVLPVVIDATRDADALVPAEFRDVQWTRLPAGATPATFAARVMRLCDNPASGEAPTDSGESELEPSPPPRAAERGTVAQPFTFAGRDYANAAQLATGLVQNWPEAARKWADGSMIEWVRQHQADGNLTATLQEIAGSARLDTDQKLAVALLALNQNLPLIWQGEMVTDAWVTAHPEPAGRLCDSGVPEWLKRLRGDDWLAGRAARRQAMLQEMPPVKVALNRALVEQLVFGPVAAIEERVQALFEEFSAANDPAIDRLLHQEELSLGEAVLLLAVPREIFVRASATTPAGESQGLAADRTPGAAAARSGAPAASTFDPEADGFFELRCLEGHAGQVSGVAFSAGVRWLVSGGKDARIVVWDPRTGEELRRMADVATPVGCVTFGPDGRSLASGGADGHVRLWEVSIGRELRRFEGHKGLVSSVAFSPSKRHLASGASDNLLILWDVWSGKEVRRMRGHEDWVSCVAFSADGRSIGSSSADHSVRLWDADSGGELRRFDGHVGIVHGMAFAADGRTLASCGADHTIRLWDTASGQELRQFAGHPRAVHAIAFSPSKPWLASAGADHTIRLWDLGSGRELQRLEAHTNMVRCLAFSGDGRWLASGSSDNSVRVWSLLSAGSLRSMGARSAGEAGP